MSTGELHALAVRLREEGRRAGGRSAPLDAEAAAAGAWCAGRAAEAAHAFFATLAQAARQAAEGLDELADRVEVAAGAYEEAEAAASR
ncbi:WXG100 family type VII secretion target [Kineococcus indalonis]|uniref:WXG100 family type VII secretion target n=1 Tax=Kineococcus indalonis TaxID=2696566 RepID=UPI00141252A6|nr:WXG100 family type VII secretion target [Kineococcus indalonis]NAZ85950.1 hypothetical protein [Kineococcus indalonis]